MNRRIFYRTLGLIGLGSFVKGQAPTQINNSQIQVGGPPVYDSWTDALPMPFPDGTTTVFQIVTPQAFRKVRVHLNGLKQSSSASLAVGAVADYTLNDTKTTITMFLAPGQKDRLTIEGTL